MTNSRLARSLMSLATVVCLLSASGATCQRQMLTNPFAPAGPSAPQVLMEGASREQIIAALNQNSSRIRSITASGATITVPDTLGLPLLSGNIAAERPGRFRLTAGTAVTGQEVDIGSNDELFWMWVRRNQPPAVYFCRHSQFANSNIRQMMPIEPSWLLAVLGMVDLDPNSVFDGPLPRGDGTVELRSWLPSAGGNLQRVTVVNARTALVTEQHVYDQSGRTLLASAVAESHIYDPTQQVAVPQVIAIRLPSASINLRINLGAVEVNQLLADRAQLWTMPSFGGAQQFDLGGLPSAAPLPHQGALPTPLTGVVPGSFSVSPQLPYPVTPTSAISSEPAPPTRSASTQSLPVYGQRPSLPSQAPRRF